jgi:hypothetical protein
MFQGMVMQDRWRSCGVHWGTWAFFSRLLNVRLMLSTRALSSARLPIPRFRRMCSHGHLGRHTHRASSFRVRLKLRKETHYFCGCRYQPTLVVPGLPCQQSIGLGLRRNRQLMTLKIDITSDEKEAVAHGSGPQSPSITRPIRVRSVYWTVFTRLRTASPPGPCDPPGRPVPRSTAADCRSARRRSGR